MASRFRVSKFKNQTLKLPDRPPKSQFGLPNSPTGASNWIASSGYLTAYLTGTEELSIASYYGTPDTKLLSICANGLSDFHFNPFHDDILALCTTTGQLRVYRVPVIPNENRTLHVKSSDSGQFVDWSLGGNHSFQALKFHPLVDSLLATVEVDSQFSLYDFTTSSTGQESSIQCWDSKLRLKSFDFDYQGKVVALGGTDLEGNNNSAFTVQLYDVRSNQVGCTAQWNDILTGSDARVLYLDGSATSSPYLLTSSIDCKKHRVVATWDSRSLTKPLASCVDFQVSTNIFLPLHDADTGVVYFALKNGNYVSHFEVDQLVAQGFDVTGSAQSIPYSIKGAALAPKRCLDVMKTELNRILLLTNQLVYPLSYHVPRKTYYDFHSDLYPDIRSPTSKITRDQLLSSSLDLPTEPKLSLNPKTTSFLKLLQFDQDIGAKQVLTSVATSEPEEGLSQSNSSASISINGNGGGKELPSRVDKTSSSSSNSKIISQESFESSVSNDSSSEGSSVSTSNGTKPKPSIKPKPKPVILKKFSVQAKFKYLKGTVGNRETQLTNVQNICKNISPLCDPFKANDKYGFFPLGTGVGGGCNQVAVVDLQKPQRLSGGVQSHLLCTDVVTDFELDPFRSNRVAVGLQSGSVLIFSIYPPEDVNLNADSLIIDQHDCKLIGHNGRVTSVLFNPLANDILATCGTDNRILIWNVATKEILYEINLSAEEQQIFSISWSRCQSGGTNLAVLGRSKKLSVYNVQTQQLVQQGTLPYKVNNGRVLWIANDQLILVTGFNGLSERQFYLYNSASLSTGPLMEHGLDVSPSILVPTFDEDTRTLFLTGKGDAIIYTFEIADIAGATAPTNLITQLSHFEAPTPHQAIAFLPKNFCDVKKLEFARGYRLTGNSIEPFSFTIPRLYMEYFHDDLFPPTTITWSPLFSATEWIDLSDAPADSIAVPERISLKPDDMQNYSEVKDQLAQEKLEKSQSNRSIGNDQSSAGSGGSFFENIDDAAFMHNFNAMVAIGREKQELLVQQISGKVEFNSAQTDLQNVEGVDPNEWDD